MQVFTIELRITDEGADAARKEILTFLRAMNEKAAKEHGHPRASRAYVVLRNLLEKLNAEIRALEKAEAKRKAASLPRQPTVKEIRP